MEFQNENGTADKGAEAKETNKQNAVSPAKPANTKPAPGNANTDAKNMRPSVPGNEKKSLPPQTGPIENKEAKQGGPGHEADQNGQGKKGEGAENNHALSCNEGAPQAGTEAIGEFQDGNNSKRGSKNGHAHQTLNNGVAIHQQQNGEQAEEKQHLNAEPKPELTLEAKLKAISDLNRKSIQRFTLIGRIKTLEDFEIKLFEGSDELTSNPYQGCKLIIEDDKRNQFTTNTP
jgi:hypothetical protein